MVRSTSFWLHYWCRKDKAFCFQQPEKDKQHVDIAPPGKISAHAHGCSQSKVPKVACFKI